MWPHVREGIELARKHWNTESFHRRSFVAFLVFDRRVQLGKKPENSKTTCYWVKGDVAAPYSGRVARKPPHVTGRIGS